MNEEKINEMLADAIADGKSAMEYMFDVFAANGITDSLTNLAEALEEVADMAHDAGITIRETALAAGILGVENLDENCGKD